MEASEEMELEREWETVFGPEQQPLGSARLRSNSDPAAGSKVKQKFSKVLAGIENLQERNSRKALTTDTLLEKKNPQTNTPEMSGAFAARESMAAKGQSTNDRESFRSQLRSSLQTLDEDGMRRAKELQDALEAMLQEARTSTSSRATSSFPVFSAILEENYVINPAVIKAVATIVVVLSAGQKLVQIVPLVVPVDFENFGEGTQLFLQYCFHELECGQRYDDMSLIADAIIGPLVYLISSIVENKKKRNSAIPSEKNECENGECDRSEFHQIRSNVTTSDTQSSNEDSGILEDSDVQRLFLEKRIVDTFTAILLGHQHSPWLLIRNQDSLVKVLKSFLRPLQWKFNNLPNSSAKVEDKARNNEEPQSQDGQTAPANKLQKFLAKTGSSHLSSKKHSLSFGNKKEPKTSATEQIDIGLENANRKTSVWGPDSNVHSLIEMGFSTEQARYACWKMLQRTSVTADNVAAKAVAWLFDMDEFERESLNSKFHTEIMPLQFTDNADNDAAQPNSASSVSTARSDAGTGAGSVAANSPDLASFGNVKRIVDELVEYFVDNNKKITSRQIEHAVYSNKPGTSNDKLVDWLSRREPFELEIFDSKDPMTLYFDSKCPPAKVVQEYADEEDVICITERKHGKEIHFGASGVPICCTENKKHSMVISSELPPSYDLGGFGCDICERFFHVPGDSESRWWCEKCYIETEEEKEPNLCDICFECVKPPSTVVDVESSVTNAVSTQVDTEFSSDMPSSVWCFEQSVTTTLRAALFAFRGHAPLLQPLAASIATFPILPHPRISQLLQRHRWAPSEVPCLPWFEGLWAFEAGMHKVGAPGSGFRLRARKKCLIRRIKGRGVGQHNERFSIRGVLYHGLKEEEDWRDGSIGEFEGEWRFLGSIFFDESCSLGSKVLPIRFSVAPNGVSLRGWTSLEQHSEKSTFYPVRPIQLTGTRYNPREYVAGRSKGLGLDNAEIEVVQGNVLTFCAGSNGLWCPHAPFVSGECEPYSIDLALKIGTYSHDDCEALQLPDAPISIEFAEELSSVCFGIFSTPQFGLGLTAEGYVIAWRTHHLPKIDEQEEKKISKEERADKQPEVALSADMEMMVSEGLMTKAQAIAMMIEMSGGSGAVMVEENSPEKSQSISVDEGGEKGEMESGPNLRVSAVRSEIPLICSSDENEDGWYQIKMVFDGNLLHLGVEPIPKFPRQAAGKMRITSCGAAGLPVARDDISLLGKAGMYASALFVGALPVGIWSKNEHSWNGQTTLTLPSGSALCEVVVQRGSVLERVASSPFDIRSPFPGYFDPSSGLGIPSTSTIAYWPFCSATECRDLGPLKLHCSLFEPVTKLPISWLPSPSSSNLFIQRQPSISRLRNFHSKSWCTLAGKASFKGSSTDIKPAVLLSGNGTPGAAWLSHSIHCSGGFRVELESDIFTHGLANMACMSIVMTGVARSRLRPLSGADRPSMMLSKSYNLPPVVPFLSFDRHNGQQGVGANSVDISIGEESKSSDDDGEELLPAIDNWEFRELCALDTVIARFPMYRGTADDPWMPGHIISIDRGGTCSIKYANGHSTIKARPEDVLWAPSRPTTVGKAGTPHRNNDARAVLISYATIGKGFAAHRVLWEESTGRWMINEYPIPGSETDIENDLNVMRQQNSSSGKSYSSSESAESHGKLKNKITQSLRVDLVQSSDKTISIQLLKYSSDTQKSEILAAAPSALLVPPTSDGCIIDLQYLPNYQPNKELEGFNKAALSNTVSPQGLILSVNGIVLLQWIGDIANTISLTEYVHGIRVGLQVVSPVHHVELTQFRAVSQSSTELATSKGNEILRESLSEKNQEAGTSETSTCQPLDAEGLNTDLYSYAEGQITKRSPKMFRVMWGLNCESPPDIEMPLAEDLPGLAIDYPEETNTDSAWVGLFKCDAPNEDYVTFEYLEKQKSKEEGLSLDMKNLTQRGVYEFRLYGDDGNDQLLGVSSKYYFGNKPGTQLTDGRRRALGDSSKPADTSNMKMVGDLISSQEKITVSNFSSSFANFDVSFEATEATSELASHLFSVLQQTTETKACVSKMSQNDLSKKNHYGDEVPYDALINGTWDTSIGILDFEKWDDDSCSAEQIGYLVVGKFVEDSENDSVVEAHKSKSATFELERLYNEPSMDGIIFLDKERAHAKWTLAFGEWINNLAHEYQSRTDPRPFSLVVDAMGKTVKGKFAMATKKGTAVWKCKRKRKEYRTNPLYSGLVNMRNGLINVCYQNSLLQCLFHTDQLRAALCHARQDLKDDSAELQATASETKVSRADIEDSAALSHRIFDYVRILFAKLLVCSDMNQATHVLQDLITPAFFERNKQQDSHSFLTVILEQLENGFKNTTDMPSAIKTLFGGMSALVFERCDAGPTWIRDPSLFMFQEISLPSRYAPITELTAVVTNQISMKKNSSDIECTIPDCPKGFELLDFNLCVGKKKCSVKTYLCISRERVVEGPITSIIVLEGCDNYDTEGEDNEEANSMSNKKVQSKTKIQMPEVPKGYSLLEIDLNQGGKTNSQRGKRVYLAYSRNHESCPIVDIQFIKGGKKSKPPIGYQKVQGNLNGGASGAPHIFLCHKSEAPITGIHIAQHDDMKQSNIACTGFKKISDENLASVGSVKAAIQEAKKKFQNASENQQIVALNKVTFAPGESDQYDFVPDLVFSKKSQESTVKDWSMYLGNRAQAAHEDVLGQLHIRHVICCLHSQDDVLDALTYKDEALNQQKVILQFSSKDEFSNVSKNVYRLLDEWRDCGANVLLYCNDGDTHAPALVIGYLLHLHHSMTLKAAWGKVRSRRHKDSVTKPSIRFFKALSDVELSHKGKKSMSNSDWQKYDGKGCKNRRPKVKLNKLKKGEDFSTTNIENQDSCRDETESKQLASENQQVSSTEATLPEIFAFANRSGGTPLTELQIVLEQDLQSALHDGFIKVTSTDWKGKTLVGKYGNGCPITDLAIYRAPHKVPRFQDWEVLDILKPDQDESYLNGNGEFGVYKIEKSNGKSKNSDYPDVFTISETSKRYGDVVDAFQIYGRDDCGGHFNGIVYSPENFDGLNKEQNWVLEGCIETNINNGKKKFLEPFRLFCRNGDAFHESTNSPRQNKLEEISRQDDLESEDNSALPVKLLQKLSPGSLCAISDIAVCVGHNGLVPEGYIKCEHTLVGDHCGNLATDLDEENAVPIWLCVKRDPNAKPITKIGIIWSGFEAPAVGQELIATDTSGRPLNLNANGRNSDVAKIVLVVEHGPQTSEKVLIDVGFVRSSASTESLKHIEVCRKSSTALKMGGDLNQLSVSNEQSATSEEKSSHSHKYFVAGLFQDSYDRIAGNKVHHPCSGIYDLSSLNSTSKRKKLSIVAVAKTPEARRCQVDFHLHKDICSRGTGIIVNNIRAKCNQSYLLVAGQWVNDENAEAVESGALSMEFSEYFADARVCWSRNSGKDSFLCIERQFIKDAYLKIAFKRDFATFMRNGKIIYSSLCQGNSIDDIIAADVTVMGGMNAVETPDGKGKTEVIRRTIITEPPRHLIVTIKRTLWDSTTMQQRKDLRSITFHPVLHIPDVPEDLKDRFTSKDESDTQKSGKLSSNGSYSSRSRAYGLYGVVVHSGTTAISGHYYSFSRHSDAPDLFRENSKLSPWMKFNDEHVTMSSWEEMTQHIRSRKTASVYLLFYRQLDPGYLESVSVASTRNSAAPSYACDDVLRPVVEDWQNEDPRWSILPMWVDEIKQKEAHRLCVDIPTRHGNFFKQILKQDAQFRTGCKLSEFWKSVEITKSEEKNEYADMISRSQKSAVTKIWNNTACILSSEIDRYRQAHEKPTASSPLFPSAPRLRIASSVIEE